VRCQVVDRAGSVQERQEGGKQPADRSSFEDDDRSAVFEQKAIAVPDEAIPRRETRPGWDFSAQSDSPYLQQHEQLQQRTSIAKCPAWRPLTLTVRSSRSLVNSSNILSPPLSMKTT
jgi:hypothetical protein